MHCLRQKQRIMAELKDFEYIIKFCPQVLQSEDGSEYCFKSESVRELIRCGRCKWRVPAIGDCLDYCVRLASSGITEDFFCGYGEKE